MFLADFDYTQYVKRQCESFFPDGKTIDIIHLTKAVSNALQRIEYCFKYIKRAEFTVFDYLHTDQYAMFLYVLANELYKMGNKQLAAKIMCLNKALNGLNCMYDNELPPLFCFIHTVGAVIGKASFGNRVVFYQGVTIGANNGQYPAFGDNVVFFSHCQVIGNCNVGSNVSFSFGTKIFNTDVPDNTLVVPAAAGRGGVIMKTVKKDYMDMFFYKEDELK
jgi:serine O-acetyltransferase